VTASFTKSQPSSSIVATVMRPGGIARRRVKVGIEGMIVGLAAAIFIALFGWGAEYFGWSDPDGKVQLALAASFVLGIVAGYKTNN